MVDRLDGVSKARKVGWLVQQVQAMNDFLGRCDPSGQAGVLGWRALSSRANSRRRGRRSGRCDGAVRDRDNETMMTGLFGTNASGQVACAVKGSYEVSYINTARGKNREGTTRTGRKRKEPRTEAVNEIEEKARSTNDVIISQEHSKYTVLRRTSRKAQADRGKSRASFLPSYGEDMRCYGWCDLACA